MAEQTEIAVRATAILEARALTVPINKLRAGMEQVVGALQRLQTLSKEPAAGQWITSLEKQVEQLRTCLQRAADEFPKLEVAFKKVIHRMVEAGAADIPHVKKALENVVFEVHRARLFFRKGDPGRMATGVADVQLAWKQCAVVVRGSFLNMGDTGKKAQAFLSQEWETLAKNVSRHTNKMEDNVKRYAEKAKVHAEDLKLVLEWLTSGVGVFERTVQELGRAGVAVRQRAGMRALQAAAAEQPIVKGGPPKPYTGKGGTIPVTRLAANLLLLAEEASKASVQIVILRDAIRQAGLETESTRRYVAPGPGVVTVGAAKMEAMKARSPAKRVEEIASGWIDGIKAGLAQSRTLLEKEAVAVKEDSLRSSALMQKIAKTFLQEGFSARPFIEALEAAEGRVKGSLEFTRPHIRKLVDELTTQLAKVLGGAAVGGALTKAFKTASLRLFERVAVGLTDMLTKLEVVPDVYKHGRQVGSYEQKVEKFLGGPAQEKSRWMVESIARLQRTISATVPRSKNLVAALQQLKNRLMELDDLLVGGKLAVKDYRQMRKAAIEQEKEHAQATKAAAAATEKATEASRAAARQRQEEWRERNVAPRLGTLLGGVAGGRPPHRPPGGVTLGAAGAPEDWQRRLDEINKILVTAQHRWESLQRTGSDAVKTLAGDTKRSFGELGKLFPALDRAMKAFAMAMRAMEAGKPGRAYKLISLSMRELKRNMKDATAATDANSDSGRAALEVYLRAANTLRSYARGVSDVAFQQAAAVEKEKEAVVAAEELAKAERESDRALQSASTASLQAYSKLETAKKKVAKAAEKIADRERGLSAVSKASAQAAAMSWSGAWRRIKAVFATGQKDTKGSAKMLVAAATEGVGPAAARWSAAWQRIKGVFSKGHEDIEAKAKGSVLKLRNLWQTGTISSSRTAIRQMTGVWGGFFFAIGDRMKKAVKVLNQHTGEWEQGYRHTVRSLQWYTLGAATSLLSRLRRLPIDPFSRAYFGYVRRIYSYLRRYMWRVWMYGRRILTRLRTFVRTQVQEFLKLDKAMGTMFAYMHRVSDKTWHQMGRTGKQTWQEMIRGGREAVFGIATEFGVLPEAVSKIFSRVYSAGIKSVEDAKVVAGAVAKIIAATGTESADQLAEAFTSAFRVFGEEVGSADQLATKFFALFQSSQATVEQTSKLLLRTAGSARVVGATWDEFAAVLARVTQVLGGTSRAGTAVRTLFKTIGMARGTEKRRIVERFAELGQAAGFDVMDEHGAYRIGRLIDYIIAKLDALQKAGKARTFRYLMAELFGMRAGEAGGALVVLKAQGKTVAQLRKEWKDYAKIQKYLNDAIKARETTLTRQLELFHAIGAATRARIVWPFAEQAGKLMAPVIKQLEFFASDTLVKIGPRVERAAAKVAKLVLAITGFDEKKASNLRILIEGYIERFLVRIERMDVDETARKVKRFLKEAGSYIREIGLSIAYTLRLLVEFFNTVFRHLPGVIRGMSDLLSILGAVASVYTQLLGLSLRAVGGIVGIFNPREGRVISELGRSIGELGPALVDMQWGFSRVANSYADMIEKMNVQISTKPLTQLITMLGDEGVGGGIDKLTTKIDEVITNIPDHVKNASSQLDKEMGGLVETALDSAEKAAKLRLGQMSPTTAGLIALIFGSMVKGPKWGVALGGGTFTARALAAKTSEGEVGAWSVTGFLAGLASTAVLLAIAEKVAKNLLKLVPWGTIAKGATTAVAKGGTAVATKGAPTLSALASVTAPAWATTAAASAGLLVVVKALWDTLQLNRELALEEAAWYDRRAAMFRLERQKILREPVQSRKAGGVGFQHGGIAAGPASGYWALLHGIEAIVPLGAGQRTGPGTSDWIALERSVKRLEDRMDSTARAMGMYDDVLMTRLNQHMAPYTPSVVAASRGEPTVKEVISTIASQFGALAKPGLSEADKTVMLGVVKTFEAVGDLLAKRVLKPAPPVAEPTLAEPREQPFRREQLSQMGKVVERMWGPVIGKAAWFITESLVDVTEKVAPIARRASDLEEQLRVAWSQSWMGAPARALGMKPKELLSEYAPNAQEIAEMKKAYKETPYGFIREWLEWAEGQHKLVGMQAGGVVTKPTLAMLAEHGAEAVVPLPGSTLGFSVRQPDKTAELLMQFVYRVVQPIDEVVKRIEKSAGSTQASVQKYDWERALYDWARAQARRERELDKIAQILRERLGPRGGLAWAVARPIVDAVEEFGPALRALARLEVRKVGFPPAELERRVALSRQQQFAPTRREVAVEKALQVYPELVSKLVPSARSFTEEVATSVGGVVERVLRPGPPVTEPPVGATREQQIAQMGETVERMWGPGVGKAAWAVTKPIVGLVEKVAPAVEHAQSALGQLDEAFRTSIGEGWNVAIRDLNDDLSRVGFKIPEFFRIPQFHRTTKEEEAAEEAERKMTLRLEQQVKEREIQEGLSWNVQWRELHRQAWEVSSQGVQAYEKWMKANTARFAQLEEERRESVRRSSTPRIAALQAGGIVTKPTVALLGERGAEAVVPLDGTAQDVNVGELTDEFSGMVVDRRKFADKLAQLLDLLLQDRQITKDQITLVDRVVTALATDARGLA